MNYFRVNDPISIVSSLKVGYIFETAFHSNKSPVSEVDGQSDQDYMISEIKREVDTEESDRNTELWTNREVVLAAKVLSAKNPKKHGIQFVSDIQMRRVYDIIFEVFRCKNEII